MSTFAANTVCHEAAFVFFCQACQFCLLGDTCFAYLLQGMIEWGQDCRAAEVDALQLRLEEQGHWHAVVKQTRVNAVRILLLDELHPMAIILEDASKSLCCVSYCLLSYSMSSVAFARPIFVLPTVDAAVTLTSAVYLWLQVAL